MSGPREWRVGDTAGIVGFIEGLDDNVKAFLRNERGGFWVPQGMLGSFAHPPVDPAKMAAMKEAADALRAFFEQRIVSTNTGGGEGHFLVPSNPLWARLSRAVNALDKLEPPRTPVDRLLAQVKETTDALDKMDRPPAGHVEDLRHAIAEYEASKGKSSA